jgi:hypothetical protein
MMDSTTTISSTESRKSARFSPSSIRHVHALLKPLSGPQPPQVISVPCALWLERTPLAALAQSDDLIEIVMLSIVNGSMYWCYNQTSFVVLSKATHSHSHMRTHARTHARTHTCTHVCAHTRGVCLCARARPHARTHARTCAHARPHSSEPTVLGLPR